MKSILTVVLVVLAIMSPTLHAGEAAEGTVSILIDELNKEGVASGTMWNARSSKNDVERIGCSYKGVAEPYVGDNTPWDYSVEQWAWCRAADAEGLEAWCFTHDPNLLDALQAISPFSFIRFEFTYLDDPNVGECTRFDFSTQSLHLPLFTTKK